MSKHTPEPWNIEPALDFFTKGLHISGPDGNGIAGLWSGESNSAKTQVANAFRIIRCVNACAGMADPAAEIAKLKAENERLINFVRLVESSVSAANPESVIGKAAKLLIEEMEAQK